MVAVPSSLLKAKALSIILLSTIHYFLYFEEPSYPGIANSPKYETA